MNKICREQCSSERKSVEEIISAEKINMTGTASQEQHDNADLLKEHT